jgi:DNA-directed RNA polymerase specialized sigma24 family protein
VIRDSKMPPGEAGRTSIGYGHRVDTPPEREIGDMARRRGRLSEEAKEILGQGLLHARRTRERLQLLADEDFAVQLFVAYERGMSLREIAALYGVRLENVQKWKDRGEQARNRRLGEDPDRPDEREQVS